MLFNSVAFLLFFPIVTTIYFLLSGWRARVILLLAASCVFYMYFVPLYILILAFTIVVDYFAGILIGKSTTYRRHFLIVSLVANIGTLAVFKYYAFLADNIAAVGGIFGASPRLPALGLLLPIGLSFHTFQAMSYTIEVYRRRQEPERDFLVYALYVMFYPQLVAGPIERPQNLLPQFRAHHSFDYARVTSGLRRMAWGMFKKVVVADRLAVSVDLIYDEPHRYHGLALIAATLLFSFQIYFDFSAYSDIALGSAKVMGFTLMENFKTPYFSRTVSEFWRRWHISLSTWFKDYVYVPLGGSRTTTARHYRNLLMVFMLSGLWHGASWTFVIWGALHGAYLVVSSMTAKFRARLWSFTPFGESSRLRGTVAVVTTFSLVTFAWIFFRARAIEPALYVARHMFIGLGQDFGSLAAGAPFPVHHMAVLTALLVVVVGVERLTGTWQKMDLTWSRANPYLRHALYALVIYGTIFGGDAGSGQQFIYFQF
jgi:alginate O-acetyltransferase complex protein AlgI